MIKRFLLSAVLLLTGLAHADWATDRAGEAGYVTVTTLASVIDEAVPFCVVYLSDMPAGFWTAMDAASDTDGKTIRVSTSDGSTQLPCVPLGVNTSTDTGCLIFLDTGSSASVDVAFRIYVGNAALTMPSASGGMGEQAVFAAYAGVYFPGMATRDFTSGGRTLTAVGTPTTAASGYEGITAAAYAAASSQDHHYNGTQAVTNFPVTMESLFYTTNTSSERRVANLGSNTDDNPDLEFSISTTPALKVFARGNSSTSSSVASTNTISTSTWYYGAVGRGSVTSDVSFVQLDGSARYSSSSNTIASATWNSFCIGARIYTGGVLGSLDGRVAFAALSSSVRSANYMSTQHQNWLGNLYSTGSWTANSTGFSMLPILTEE